jgi:parallel beta-helix repeat protein
MKKWALVAFSFTILILYPNVQIQVAKAQPSTVRVPRDYQTIQAAIDAVQPEGTILVSAGTYYENIMIRKPLQLIGDNKDNTTIIGARNGTIEVISINNVSIKDLTVKNNVSATTVFPIRLHYSNNCRIEDCNLIAVSVYSGVWLEWSHNNLIKGNNVTNRGDYGIYLFEACNNTIADNFVASDNGILFSTYCEGNIIIGNTIITSNKPAFYLYTCSNNTAFHNSFINMTTPVYSVNSVNVWDNGFQEGNYWSAYSGTFNETTGIGSTPYIIDASNHDDYPLRCPYILGDANHDGGVNMTDVEITKQAWLFTNSEANYNPHADFNMDGIVNIADATVIGWNWQKTSPF